jgi:hypothetical protein
MRYFVGVARGFCLGCLILAAASSASAQQAVAAATAVPSAVKPSTLSSKSSQTASVEDKGRFGFAVKTSLLGVGAEIAARATHRTNVRAGFNVLGYSRGFNKDGIDYAGHLTFRTVEAHYDIFPWARSFHVSPGMLAYVGNPISASALVPGNQSFTLAGNNYFSDPAQPISAKGKVTFNRVSPMITAGFGNLVHRDTKRFTVPIEFGVAFQGSPKTSLNLAGNVCDSPGVNCRSVASDPTVQSNVISEQAKLDKSMRPFKVYPVISVGFGYKF